MGKKLLIGSFVLCIQFWIIWLSVHMYCYGKSIRCEVTKGKVLGNSVKSYLNVILTKILFGLNIFHSKEKDWVWHKTRHNPLQYPKIRSRVGVCWTAGQQVDLAPGACFIVNPRGSSSMVIAQYTSGQQVRQSILHLGHDSC